MHLEPGDAEIKTEHPTARAAWPGNAARRGDGIG